MKIIAMQEVLVSLRWIHILSGGIALLSGLLAILSRKGSGPHRKGGKIYVLAMLFNGISALIMAPMVEKPMLIAIGVFSLYMVLTGYHAVGQIRIPVWGMILMMGASLLAGVWMVMTMSPVLLAFGSILLLFVALDLRNLLKQGQAHLSLMMHAGRIIGSYIAASTAFVVVNLSLEGNWNILLWLGPSIPGVMLIRYWGQRIRKGEVQITRP